eukprot:1170914-Amorphochlora_amoeboformis.AAC.1
MVPWALSRGGVRPSRATSAPNESGWVVSMDFRGFGGWLRTLVCAEGGDAPKAWADRDCKGNVGAKGGRDKVGFDVGLGVGVGFFRR